MQKHSPLFHPTGSDSSPDCQSGQGGRLKLASLFVLVFLLLTSVSSAQLSGSYTIGPSGNYSSFSAAVSALTGSGVSGPVTFNVLAGTFNETITIPSISGASATNTITFDGGTGNAASRVLTYSASSSYTNLITLNGADYIRIRNISIISTGASYGTCVLFTNSADHNEITDCIIQTPLTSSNSQHVGIRASTTSSTGSSGDHGSYNLIKDNQISGGYAGIYWYGSGSSDYSTVQGNQFIGNTVTEYYYYGIRIYYAGGSLVVKNNSSVQRDAGASSSGYAYYIYYPNNGPEIAYNYGRANTCGLYMYRPNYYYASTANRARVYNNMAIADGETSTLYGIYCSYPRYTDVMYNSARLLAGGDGTGSNTGYMMYQYGESSNYDVRWQNNMASYEGTGTLYWFYNYYYESFSVCDYNVFYRVGSGTDYFRWDGTSYVSLAAAKSAWPAYNQHSTIGDPNYFSNTDLHSTSMTAYLNATPVSGYTDDFDGDTRSLTTPCIGADEFVLSNMSYASSTCTQNNTDDAPAGFADQEIIGIEVDVNGSLTPINATSFTLSTAGSTTAADISAAKIYYTGRTNTFDATTLFGTYNNPSGSFTISGSQTLEGPGTNYFWLAYDIAASAPTNNYVDGQCTSVTVGGSAYTPTVTNPAGNRRIIAPMNGIYTINPAGSGSRNYTSFGAAIADLQVYGAGGNITFEVAAATYNEQISVPEILGASATSTITFDGGTGNAASRIITYSAGQYDAVVTLNGADYIRFRNLTVNSTNSSYGYGFLFTAEADYNEITDCVINLPSTTTNSYHVGICASSTSSYSAYGDWGDYNLIKDNTINSGYYGIRWNGSGSSTNLTQCIGNQFIGNTVQDFYYYGMYLYYSVGVRVIDNTVVQRSSGTYTTSSGYGIYVYYPNDGPIVANNYAEAHYNPLRVYRINNAYNSTANRGMVYNNMGVGVGTSTMYGLYVSYAAYADIVYNSMNLINNSSTCYGLYEYGQSSNYDVKVANNYISYQGDGTFYAIYNYYYESQALFDYNAFYHEGTGTEQWRWDGTYYTSLSALQSAVPAQHQNTVEGNPYFVAQNDLHSRSNVGYLAGTPWPTVTTDYDGEPRHVSTPCIGADEYPEPPAEYDIAVRKVLVDYATDKWARLEDPATHKIKVLVENAGLIADPGSFDIGISDAPMNGIGDAMLVESFNPTWDANGKAVVEFKYELTGLAPVPSATLYARAFLSTEQRPVNDQGSDTHEVFNYKVHGFENFQNFEDNANFTYADGYLDMPWTVYDVNGGTTPEIQGEAIVMNSGASTVDEWIFTPAATLLEASSYRVGFDFANNAATPVSVEIAYGMSPSASSMTTFATFSNIGIGNYTAKQLWIASGEAGEPYFNTPIGGAGMYYIGIHIVTSTINAEWSMDNIKLDDNPSPPPKIGYGAPGDPVSSLINTTTPPIVVTVNYKSPNPVNRTFQVANTINIYGQNGDFLWDVESADSWISITKETPDPTLQGYNFTPPRPRQFQTFTMTINPAGLAPGKHIGYLTFYGILFNDDFPPPNSGLLATNEPLVVPVELNIVSTGGKGGPASATATFGPMTVPGSPYTFIDPNSGTPIATVRVTAGQIDKMTITCYPNQLPQNLARMLYVKRYWQITHTGTGWTADIDFPYAATEASMIFDPGQLRGVRQAVPLGAWEDPIMGTTSYSDVLNSSVTVMNLNDMNIGGNIALAHPYMIFGRGSEEVPTQFGLAQNYPNPFNPSTSIVYNVPEQSHVRIAVYNSLGAEVAVLVDRTQAAGRYEAQFDAVDLPSGTYLYRMTAGDFTQTRMMTLSK
ncbi:T9SS type A sorting domain-containing protein [bacterium]|nr:T9SS type A sorting domain-containing protein [bacterium]